MLGFGKAKQDEYQQLQDAGSSKTGKQKLKGSLKGSSYEEQQALLGGSHAPKESWNPVKAFFNLFKKKTGKELDISAPIDVQKTTSAEQLMELLEHADDKALAAMASNSSFLMQLESTLNQEQFDKAMALLHPLQQPTGPSQQAPAPQVQQPQPSKPASPNEEAQLEQADAVALDQSDGVKVDTPQAIHTTFADKFLDGYWQTNHPGQTIKQAISSLAGKFKMAKNLVLAVIGYTGPGYKPVNMLMRGQIKSQKYKNAIQPHVDEIKAGLAALPSGKEDKLYRVWNRYNPSVEKYRIAHGQTKIVEDPGFVSTAVQPAFDGGPFDWNTAPIRFAIDAKGGGKAVDEFSIYPNEAERLYGGLRLEVYHFEANPDGPDLSNSQILIKGREV